MSDRLARPYTVYALTLLALLLLIALPFYLIGTLVLPYRKKIAWVYFVNRAVIRLWCPLIGLQIKAERTHVAAVERSSIVIMNHSSLLDMFAAARRSVIPGKPLIKKEILKVPILGWIFAGASVPVNRSDAESRQRSYERLRSELQRGVSLLIFPEGTRNRDASVAMTPFRDGAFRLSMETGAPLVPVLILHTRLLNIGKTLVFKPGKIVLYYLDPIWPTEFENTEELKSHTFRVMEAAMLEKDDYFSNKDDD